MFVRRTVAALLLLVATYPLHGAAKDKEKIEPDTSLPVNKSRASGFMLKYVNPLRFNFSVTSTDTPIAAPVAPSAIAPGSLGSAVFPLSSTPPNTARALNDGPGDACPNAIKGYDNLEPNQAIDCVRDNLVKAAAFAFDATTTINSTVESLAEEQRCYKRRISAYSSWRVNKGEADKILSFASANQIAVTSISNLEAAVAVAQAESNAAKKTVALLALDNFRTQEGASSKSATGACVLATVPTWPINKIEGTRKQLMIAQSVLALISSYKGDETKVGYREWFKNQDNAASDRIKSLSDLIASDLDIINKNTSEPASFNDAVIYITFWRDRLASIVERSDDLSGSNTTKGVDNPNGLFIFTAASNCNFAWYGRGDTRTTSLTATDISVSPAVPTTTTVLVNSCYPVGTVSTGLGVSLVHDNVYAFEPSPNPASANTTISTIQKTTDAAATPLYVLQYNAAIWESGDKIGVHGTFGAGAGSSSGTTNLEFVVGPSLSFHRRAFFIAPLLQFARRDELLPGYSVGSAKNDLQSLPITTNWKPGFALTFTLGVGP